MKKIFTLLFAVGIFAGAQAQPGYGNTRQTDRRNDQPPTDQRNYPTTDRRNDQPTTDQRNYPTTDRRNDQPVNQPDQRDHNYGYNDQRDVVYERNNSYDNDNRYGNGIMSPTRKRDMQIAQINREYDFKIQRVWNSFFMNRWDKQRQVRFLEDQRQWEIRKVYAQSNGRGSCYDDHDYYNRRY